MQLVDNDTVRSFAPPGPWKNKIRLCSGQFLKQLAALFESSKDFGSVWLTHKRCMAVFDIHQQCGF